LHILCKLNLIGSDLILTRLISRLNYKEKSMLLDTRRSKPEEHQDTMTISLVMVLSLQEGSISVLESTLLEMTLRQQKTSLKSIRSLSSKVKPIPLP
jgi:hypothetical protein